MADAWRRRIIVAHVAVWSHQTLPFVLPPLPFLPPTVPLLPRNGNIGGRESP